jgi:hypothetical protein
MKGRILLIIFILLLAGVANFSYMRAWWANQIELDDTRYLLNPTTIVHVTSTKDSNIPAQNPAIQQ